MDVDDGELHLAAHVLITAVAFKKLIEKNVRAELGILFS